MRRHRNRRVRLAALMAALVVGLWQGAAFAGDDPPNLSGPEAPQVEGPPEPDGGGTGTEPPPVPEQPAQPMSHQEPPAPPIEGTSDSDSPGHETEDPQPPDHASATSLDIKVTNGDDGLQDVVRVGHTNAEIDRRDDSSRGDASVLAIGGDTIIGVESDSEGTQEDEINPLGPLCEGSEGQLCVGLLFARSESTETDRRSHSRSDVAAAQVCLGGDDPADPCPGAPIQVGAAQSHSEIEKDKRSGSMRAQSGSSVANATVRSDESLVIIGVAESYSRSESDSRNSPGRTERASCILTLGGECLLSDPAGISVPLPDCPGDPGSIACIFANQGEGLVFTGGAQSAQEAVHVDILRSDSIPGGRLIQIHAATAETLVRAQQPLCPDGTPVPPGGRRDCPDDDEFCPDGVTPLPPGGRKKCPDGPPINGPNGGGGRLARGTLAATGIGFLPWVALSLILGAGGAGALLGDRRRPRR